MCYAVIGLFHRSLLPPQVNPSLSPISLSLLPLLSLALSPRRPNDGGGAATARAPEEGGDGGGELRERAPRDAPRDAPRAQAPRARQPQLPRPPLLARDLHQRAHHVSIPANPNLTLAPFPIPICCRGKILVLVLFLIVFRFGLGFFSC